MIERIDEVCSELQTPVARKTHDSWRCRYPTVDDQAAGVAPQGRCRTSPALTNVNAAGSNQSKPSCSPAAGSAT